jgi:hypothetical protein
MSEANESQAPVEDKGAFPSFSEWLANGDSKPMAGGALESNINGLWFAKQTAKGSPVTFTTGTKRGRWVGGDLQVNRADGEEAWSDQTLFADTVDFANTLIGNGAPVVQGQSSLTAYLAWISCGQESVTGGTNAVSTLTMTGAPTGGTYTLSVTLGGNTYTTAPIVWNSVASVVLAAIQAAWPGPWGVTASPGPYVVAAGGPFPATPITLTLSNGSPVTGAGLGFQPAPTITATTSALTGGTAPAIAATASTPGVGYTHVATPADTGGFWFGCVKSVGKSTVYRTQFNDCRMQSLRIEGSSASKVVKLTPTFLSLDPGQVITADPTGKDDYLKPFIYTEAQGTFTIDGIVYRGQSSFAVLFTWGLNEYYGDAVTPLDVINNTATATIEGLTLLIDANGLTRYFNQIYGNPSPAPGARPIAGIPLIGSYSCLFTRTNPYTGQTSESLSINLPGVKWAPTLAIPANPAGGAVELSFTGAMRKLVDFTGVSTTAPFTITTVEPLDAAFTV